MAVGHNQALYDKYRDRGFEVLGINLWRGVEDTVAYMRERGLTYPSVQATPDVLKAYGGIGATPTRFLLNKDGIILKKYVGTDAAMEEELEETVASLLGLAVARKKDLAVPMVESATPEASTRPLPDLMFPTLDGRAVKLSDYRGKVLLVDVWFLGSELARATLEHHQYTYEQFQKEGLEVLGISLDSSNLPALREYLGKQGITYTNVLATGEALAAFGGINFIPTVFLVDQRGAIQKRYESFSSEAYAEIDATIVNLLGLVKPGERYVPGSFDSEGPWVKGRFERIEPEGRER